VTASALRTDPVLLEVLRNRFKAVAEEMAATTLHTAFTVFVKETQDFGACLVSPGGEVFAAPTDTAVSTMAGLPAWEVVASLAPYAPGDVGIANDPETTRGLSTHLPDLWLWKPIFAGGEDPVAFGLTFVHSSDVGGKVAGSISPTSAEIYEEGIRVPPMRLFRAGQPNRDLIGVLLANSRIPQQNWGDIKAQLAALSVAERRIGELVERYGRDAVGRGIEDVMAHAEARARALIAEIPDGDYEFSDYMEGDDFGAGMIRIKLRMGVRGERVMLDFEGTDHQVAAALNLPSFNQRGHRQICFGLLNHFRTRDPAIPYNSGLLRPVELRIPPGSLLNPEPGAACGVRAATMFRVLDCLLGCLTQALPAAAPAAGSGAIAIVLLSVLDPVTGERRVEVAQPLNGGSGGRPSLDGTDGSSFAGGWLRNVPNEVLEADLPVLVEEYGYRVGSEGAGRRRGGAGIRFRLRNLAPSALVTARGLERFTFRPWGVRGGAPGALGRVRLNPGTPRERELGKLDVLRLTAGDVVEFLTAGGGGYGDPVAREPERLARDLADGLLEGRERYARPGGTATFAFGAEREAYERRWSDALTSALVRSLARYPATLRALVGGRVRGHADALAEPPGVAQLPALVAGVERELGLVAR
jgi:N-methylhydantoinase B